MVTAILMVLNGDVCVWRTRGVWRLGKVDIDPHVGGEGEAGEGWMWRRGFQIGCVGVLGGEGLYRHFLIKD
jgi:hypothetical protein